MVTSKLLPKFEEFSSKGQLIGNILRIELVSTPGEDEEGHTKTKGGILIAQYSNQKSDFSMLKPVLGVVLEKGVDCEIEGLEVGSVVWVPAAAIGRLSVIPETGEGMPNAKMALVNESNVRKIWRSIEDFAADTEQLQG